MRKKDFKRKSRRSGRNTRTYPELVGCVQMSREGFIYVIPESSDEADIFVRAARTRNALNGDIVRVAVTQAGSENRRREGEVVQIVERSTKPFVGILHFAGSQAWVLMQSKSMPYDIEVDRESLAALGAEAGMKVSVVVDRWDRRDPSPVGHIVDVLGTPGENDTEMHAILAEFDLPYRFEKDVEDAADKISEKITASDMEGRRDFRDIFTFTIDPTDAKDFDDALSFRTLANGNYEVGVHIADVSWYVLPGSPVDKEAQSRGTSVYLVDRTVPMLPEKLCNKLCSLRPNEDKLTFSAVFEMTPDAKVLKSWIGRTAIRSDFRLDYGQAQSIIEAEGLSDTSESKDGLLREAIVVLNGMAAKLKQARFKAGAIDFDRPEMKVLVDEEGRPVDVYEKRSMEANWLIEEFMLLANRTVAQFVAQKNKVFVYRVHGEPNPAKLEQLRSFSKGFGYKMGETGDGQAAARSISKLLDKAKGKPEFAAFEDIALRSMAKATYSTENIGHYGLAFKYYTHFTSPIRRYPDLMVHRLLALYLGAPVPSGSAGASGQVKLDVAAQQEYYEQQCKHASEREIVAADAERTSVKYKLVEFMQDKVGQQFTGHVSGVTDWGIYVAIEPTKIEGMIPLRNIRSDFFEFDEKLYRVVGRSTKKIYRLGDEVQIKVSSANLEQRLLDYELVEEIVQEPAPEPLKEDKTEERKKTTVKRKPKKKNNDERR